jgi:hypothetical protein
MTYTSSDSQKSKDSQAQRGAVRCGLSQAVVGARRAPGMTQGEHGGAPASEDFARGDKFPMLSLPLSSLPPGILTRWGACPGGGAVRSGRSRVSEAVVGVGPAEPRAPARSSQTAKVQNSTKTPCNGGRPRAITYELPRTARVPLLSRAKRPSR